MGLKSRKRFPMTSKNCQKIQKNTKNSKMNSISDQKELYIDTADLPVKNLDLFADTLANTANRKTKEIAYEFIKKLEDAFKTGNLQNMSYLYDYVFNKLSSTVFSNKRWPGARHLPNFKKIHPVVVQLYNELTYRHIFARLNSSVNIQTRLDTFSNYVDLLSNDFQPKQLDKNQLPASWIWDILDEFIYQFVSFCFYKNKLGSGSESEEKKLINETNLPTLTQVTDILSKFINNSNILDDKQRFNNLPSTVTTQHLFGYYSYAAKIKLMMSTGFFEEAKQLVNYFDFKVAQVYTKAWSSLVNLFYFSGLNYLKNHQFVFCGRLLEQVVNFYLKYGHFYSK